MVMAIWRACMTDSGLRPLAKPTGLLQSLHCLSDPAVWFCCTGVPQYFDLLEKRWGAFVTGPGAPLPNPLPGPPAPPLPGGPGLLCLLLRCSPCSSTPANTCSVCGLFSFRAPVSTGNDNNNSNNNNNTNNDNISNNTNNLLFYLSFTGRTSPCRRQCPAESLSAVSMFLLPITLLICCHALKSYGVAHSPVTIVIISVNRSMSIIAAFF